MRMRVIRAISWCLTFVAIGAAAAAWFTPQPDVDAEMAGEISIRALENADVEGAVVVGTPKRATHVGQDADAEEIEVLEVVIGLNDEEFEILVDAEEGQLVYVDDLVGEDGDQRALSEEQWDSVEFYRDDHRDDEWVERNVTGSIAAAVIVVVGFALARRTGEVV